MEIIEKIQNLIINNDIENAYETIMENENLYINNAQYWNLRGMLCFKVQEYNSAISCYKTSIRLEESYLDGYFNLAYAYKIIGEKVKSVLYGGISLRYTDDLDFINDIKNLYEDEVLVRKYHDILEQVKSSSILVYNEVNLIKYISAQFNDIDKVYIEELAKEDIAKKWAYVNKEFVMTSKEILTIEDFILSYKCGEWDVVVPYNINYIDITRDLASKGIEQCFIIVPTNHRFELIEINSEIMNSLKKKDYKRTVSLNKFNAADSNVYALIKYMPEKYKDKYKLNIINGRDVLSIENIVKVPLISSITVSGFNTFVSYPKFTYNIDVGHGSFSFKAAGLMDKKNKNFAFTPDEYKNIDKICITSTMNMITLSAMTATPEDKYVITGNPRTDLLLLTDGRKNLEKLLNMKLMGKKIIFNMPTFNTHENSGIVNGAKELNDSIKIKDFDYEKFDKFLEENRMICVSKVHHAEEKTVKSKTQNRKLKNMVFISNEDLDRVGFDLYEILNGADILFTDYSSIYGDFLFMDKPTIFINTDLEVYRKERGIILEPYDFWAAGPKVHNESLLQREILNILKDKNYYRKERDTIKEIFYYHKDEKATTRVWEFIDSVLTEKYTLKKYIDNCKIIEEAINKLKMNTSTIKFIEILDELMGFIQSNYQYNNLEKFKVLVSTLEHNVLDNIHDNMLNISSILSELIVEIKEYTKINVFFYGKDKYNLFKKSLSKNYEIIENLDQFINNSDISAKGNFNILIISEETTQSNIDLTLHFDEIIYYDNVMNKMLGISEKIYYNNYDYNFLLKSLEKTLDKDTETIVVGNSYPLTGIDVRLLNSKSVNLALSSQDLYYSFKLAQLAINNNENIKKCIIGSGYYLVNHDLSKSKNEDAINRVKTVYYPILKDKHNSEKVDKVEMFSIKNVLNDVVIDNLFNLDFLDKYFKELIYRDNGSYFNLKFTREMNSMLQGRKLNSIDEMEKWRLGEWRANQHNKLSKYKDTIKEYDSIFKEFIEFLNEKCVEPIIVLFPTTKYYDKFLDKDYEQDFYNTLGEIQKKYNIKVVDFTKKNIFNEDDFIDFDHMSELGAKKITDELNKLL